MADGKNNQQFQKQEKIGISVQDQQAVQKKHVIKRLQQNSPNKLLKRKLDSPPPSLGPVGSSYLANSPKLSSHLKPKPSRTLTLEEFMKLGTLHGSDKNTTSQSKSGGIFDNFSSTTDVESGLNTSATLNMGGTISGKNGVVTSSGLVSDSGSVNSLQTVDSSTVGKVVTAAQNIAGGTCVDLPQYVPSATAIPFARGMGTSSSVMPSGDRAIGVSRALNASVGAPSTKLSDVTAEDTATVTTSASLPSSITCNFGGCSSYDNSDLVPFKSFREETVDRFIETSDPENCVENSEKQWLVSLLSGQSFLQDQHRMETTSSLTDNSVMMVPKSNGDIKLFNGKGVERCDKKDISSSFLCADQMKSIDPFLESSEKEQGYFGGLICDSSQLGELVFDTDTHD